MGDAVIRIVLAYLAAILLAVTLYLARQRWAHGPFVAAPTGSAMPEEDLANLWMAGHLARLGHLDWLYTASLFEHWRQHLFGASLGPQPWIYPPTVLLIGVPISFLPLVSAYVAWDVATFAIGVLLLRHARLPWPVLLFGLCAPAGWRSLQLGQYGIVTGALVVAGLLLAPRRPVQAGIMLGLCTLKPQQGVVVPVAWLAARGWRAIAAAAATLLLLASAVVATLGPQAWSLFFTQASLSMRALVEAPPPTPYISTGISVFWAARTLGSGIPAAYALQAATGLAASILVYRAWRRPDADPMARMAVTACLSLMITPYGYTCDMVAYSIALAAIVARQDWRIRPLHGLLWLWPGCCQLVAPDYGMVLNPVAVATTAALAWRQLARP